MCDSPLTDVRLKYQVSRYRTTPKDGGPMPLVSLWTDAEIAALLEHGVTGPIDGFQSYSYLSGAGDVTALIVAAPSLASDVHITGTDLGFDGLGSLHARLARIERKLETQAPQLVNDRVSVHVPGLGLLLIDEVEVAYDCCTERLQDKLTEGWRIVAACPQPDRRRPDYILGRTRTR